MRQPYQIASGRAAQRVRLWTEEENPTVQLILLTIELLALSQQGSGPAGARGGTEGHPAGVGPGSRSADGRSASGDG